MKRDIKLVYEIAKAIEGQEGPCGIDDLGLLEEYPHQTVAYHLHLMASSGLIEGKATGLPGGRQNWTSLLLTWSGHELMDRVRENLEAPQEGEYLHPLE